MATPQPGIFVEGTRSHRHLEFNLHERADPAAALPALRALAAVAADSGPVHVVVGFAPRLWRAIAPGAVPHALAEFPAVPGVPVTQPDLWVWCHGTGDDALFDVTSAVAAAVRPVASVRHEVAGWVYHDNRDLTGFIDGTENPTADEAPSVTTTADGGSFAITQRWVHDLDGFGSLPVEEQERVIGRTKADSVELADEVRPPTAHISRVVIEDADGDELEIYRRSVPYGSVHEHGLHFVAFSADPSRFEAMLRRMFGADDGVHDRLTDFSTPVTGAAWWVPSVESLASVIG